MHTHSHMHASWVRRQYYSDPHFSFLATNTVLANDHESTVRTDKIGLHAVGVLVIHRDSSMSATVGITRLASFKRAGRNARG